MDPRFARRFAARCPETANPESPGPVGQIPQEVDAAILAAAGRHAFRRRWRRRAVPLAAAAAVLAGILIVQRSFSTVAAPDVSAPDVVDALRLRIALASGTASADQDVDGDGRVDAADVTALLDGIVRLPADASKGRNG